MTQCLQLERDRAIATLWLDRPAKRNALDGELVRAFSVALDEVATDAAIRVVVIRGRGAMFSSGIDHTLLLEVFQAAQRAPFLHVHHQLQDTFHRMNRLQKPVIVALHGVAVGMGLELALAADVRIATEDCVFGLPEIAFGIVPDVGGTTRLVRAVGEPRARELIMTGRMFRGRVAERYGLVHELCTADELDATITRRATALAAHPPAALGLAKTLCQLSADTDSGTSYRLEGIIQQSLIGQPDASQFAAGVAFIKAGIASAV
ncbi:MAG: enoyl-CoA hydratase/isomerase family protein [Kofleriaceae bacterium]